MAKSAKKKKSSDPMKVSLRPESGAGTPEEEAKSPTVRVHPLVVAFVVFHVCAITLYSLPPPSQAVLENKVKPRMSDWILKFNQEQFKQWAPFYGYAYITGMWQYWDMFAPDPANTDFYCDAEVIYLDGTKKLYKYPRIKEQTLPMKFMLERHRKYFERVNQDNFALLWVSFGQAIAYKMADDPNNPPVQVNITRHFQVVAKHTDPVGPEPPYNSYTFFRYVPDLTKLYADKGWKLGVH